MAYVLERLRIHTVFKQLHIQYCIFHVCCCNTMRFRPSLLFIFCIQLKVPIKLSVYDVSDVTETERSVS